jgi:hypothetical protein
MTVHVEFNRKKHPVPGRCHIDGRHTAFSETIDVVIGGRVFLCLFFRQIDYDIRSELFTSKADTERIVEDTVGQDSGG